MEPPDERALIDKCSQRLKRLGYDVYLDMEVVDGKSHYGKTDIIALKGETIYAIEAKHATNAKKWRKVIDQSIIYSSLLKWKFNDKIVKAYIFTDQLHFIQEMSLKEARVRVADYFKRINVIPLRPGEVFRRLEGGEGNPRRNLPSLPAGACEDIQEPGLRL